MWQVPHVSVLQEHSCCSWTTGPWKLGRCKAAPRWSHVITAAPQPASTSRPAQAWAALAGEAMRSSGSAGLMCPGEREVPVPEEQRSMEVSHICTHANKPLPFILVLEADRSVRSNNALTATEPVSITPGPSHVHLALGIHFNQMSQVDNVWLLTAATHQSQPGSFKNTYRCP